MTEPTDPLTTTHELPDDADYAWWRNSHPAGFILAVRARIAPMLHRSGCSEVDRDRHPKRLRAAGSRQICGETKVALRAWVAREGVGEAGLVARCPKCSP